MAEEDVVRLIERLSNGLHNEIQGVRDELKNVNARLDRMDVRLERQGGIIQAGVRANARLLQWSENIDQLLADRDKRIESLERRMSDLESRQ